MNYKNHIIEKPIHSSIRSESKALDHIQQYSKYAYPKAYFIVVMSYICNKLKNINFYGIFDFRSSFYFV